MNKTIFPEWTSDDTQKVRALCEGNADLWFPKGFGFDPFTLPQIQHALLDPDVLQFKLNKARGRGLLYGVRHAALRRDLANLYPPDRRAALWRERLRRVGVLSHIESFIEVEKSVVVDIGMGHTVLHWHLPGHSDKGWVLKQEEFPHHQLFFCILKALSWLSLSTESHFFTQSGWQMTPYIAGDTLSILASTTTQVPHLSQLARLAALGDLLGREDRHNENYIVTSSGYIPIDTAVLYGAHNESWNFKYTAGGLYEISTLAGSLWEGLEAHHYRFFVDHYRLAHQELSVYPLSDLVSSLMQAFPTVSAEAAGAFIRHREGPEYVEACIIHYTEALKEMLRRIPYRMVLADIWSKSPQLLEAYPVLKMYALAHEGRIATFFLAEERPWIFQEIEVLSRVWGVYDLLERYTLHAQQCIALLPSL